jgi:PadR family transcriptional regulator PadR
MRVLGPIRMSHRKTCSAGRSPRSPAAFSSARFNRPNKNGKKDLTFYTVRHTVYAIQWVLHSMTIEPNLFENLRLELRRGSLILAVLAQLRSEQYGYTLRKALAEHGMAIDEGTLYPLLRRLESQGLLVSEWREEDKRNKRFYLLSADGKAMLKQLLVEWKSIDSSLNGIVRR